MDETNAKMDLPEDGPNGSTPETRVRVTRKEPCPCGSGKKFKNCCIGNPAFELAEDSLVAAPSVAAPAQAKRASGEKPFSQSAPKPAKSFKPSNVVHHRKV